MAPGPAARQEAATAKARARAGRRRITPIILKNTSSVDAQRYQVRLNFR
jgi:hypothetical protein